VQKLSTTCKAVLILSIQGIALSAMPAKHIWLRLAQPDEHTTQL
jgi:hypothetical protein